MYYQITIMSFSVFMLFISCRTKKSNPIKKSPSIEELSASYKGKAHFKRIDRLTGRPPNAYIEFVLVSNIHPNPDSARLQEYTYFEENNSICLMEDDINYFTMHFYKWTDCTKYFTDHESVYGGYNRKVIYEDCIKDEEGLFLYVKSEEHPNWWISNLDEKTWGRTYNDTIICNKPK